MSQRRPRPDPHSRIPIEALTAHCDQLVQGALAVNSSRTYRQAINTYRLFAQAHDAPPEFPSNIQHLAMFIAYLSFRNFAPNSIITYASAMAQATLSAIGINLASHFIYKKLTKSIRRQRLPDSRLPVTKGVLQSLTSATPSVCNTAFEASMFNAAFSLAFHGLLRVSEFCSTRSTLSYIRAQHLKVSQDGKQTALKLTIPHSKNDQLHHSATLRLHSLGQEHKDICPVRLMLSYLQVRPAFQNDQPLFLHLDRSPLTENQFAHVFRACLDFAQVPGVRAYSSHSFRIGGATALAAQGIEEEQIKQAGRWRSDAYKSYVRKCPDIPWL